jgi:hypothetical protein
VYAEHIGAWRAEHRIVAAEILGRDLRHWDEPIIHLDGVMDNNSPENLYVFPSYEEMQKYLKGERPPLVSNIAPPPVYRGV